MTISCVDELKKNIQELIEERAPAGNWTRAYGTIKPCDNGLFRDHRVDIINPASSEAIDDWLTIQSELEKLLKQVGKKWCQYDLVCGETIKFEFTE